MDNTIKRNEIYAHQECNIKKDTNIALTKNALGYIDDITKGQAHANKLLNNKQKQEEKKKKKKKKL